MSKWIYDIESNGLLKDATRIWVIHALNLNTQEELTWLEGDTSWMECFDKATLLVGHNILGYDNYILKKLYGYEVKCNCHDTLIMSQLLDYRRFFNAGHSLEVWGNFLGEQKIDWRGRCIELGLIEEKSPKGEEFKQFHPEMVDYCRQDVKVNSKVYEVVLKEFKILAEKKPSIKVYMKAEHYVAKWCSEASLHGWPFDVEAAEILYKQLEEVLQKAINALQSKLGSRCIAKDKVNEKVLVKRPKWTREGLYDAHTARWFGVDPCSGLDDSGLNGTPGHRQILGEFCRVEFRPLSLSSSNDVKLFLFKHGWVPTEFNWKTDPDNPRKKKRMSPKITEDSLELLGGDGKLYTEFLTASSRFSILKTWLKEVDSDGNLHGDCMTIGTPSMRMRHSIIVNVPSGELNKDGSAVSPWGPEMRKLFKCRPGWKLIGCDSAGNQARGLAHYLGNEDFTNILLNGDIHQYNADKATAALKEMGIDHVVPRPTAKRILYALLFGGSGGKLWSYIFGNIDVKKGNEFKTIFLKVIPGFKNLLDKLDRIFGSTSKIGDGYIPGLAGNRVYVDSFHKLLVYLLQACEKSTCSTAVMLTMQQLEKEGIPYVPLIFYHDELDMMVPEEYSVRAAEIGKNSFKEGPKLLGVNIMDGSGKIGDTWFDVH